jgi:hypothetical protein
MRSIFIAATMSLLAVPALAADETQAAAPPAPAAAVPDSRCVPAGGTASRLASGCSQFAPLPSSNAPEGATARCTDGTFTKSHTYTGACSSHHGVAVWYKGI